MKTKLVIYGSNSTSLMMTMLLSITFKMTVYSFTLNLQSGSLRRSVFDGLQDENKLMKPSANRDENYDAKSIVMNIRTDTNGLS